jgi:hypothetical protein
MAAIPNIHTVEVIKAFGSTTAANGFASKASPENIGHIGLTSLALANAWANTWLDRNGAQSHWADAVVKVTAPTGAFSYYNNANRP